MQSLVNPEPLKPGDKVAVIAPSSPLHDDTILTVINSIKALDLKPVITASCKMNHGYLAGTDTCRAKDINNAFISEEIRGIFCMRGGYGSMRLLPMIDFESIKNHPKVFVGYSDITALHTVLNQQCGFITFHGPMPAEDYAELDSFTLSSLKKRIFGRSIPGVLENPENELLQTLYHGSASGSLTGGNLTVIAAMLGTPYEIDTKDKILFLEDVGEPLYRLDRAFTSLALAGKFRDCRGIILGTFRNCDAPSCSPSESLNLRTIINEIILPHEKPAVFNLRAGHVFPQTTLPMGAPVILNATAGSHKPSPHISVL